MPPAASAATPSSWPRPSVPRSPGCAAPPSSTSCARSAPTTSSTTPGRTSPDGAQRYDLVLDIAGNPSLRRLRRALTPHGTAVILGGEQGRGRITGGFGRSLRAPLVSVFVKQRLTMVAAKENADDLERLAPLLDDGRVTPAVDRTYPLEQVTDAMRQLVAGDVRGKVALTL